MPSFESILKNLNGILVGNLWDSEPVAEPTEGQQITDGTSFKSGQRFSVVYHPNALAGTSRFKDKEEC